MRRRALAASGLAILLGIARQTVGSAASEEEARQALDELRRAVQARVGQLPALVPATDLSVASFSVQRLNEKPTELRGKRYDAFRFQTPETPGTFFWAFRPPKNVARWSIVPDAGEMKGFTSFVRRKAPRDIASGVSKDEFVYAQTLPAGSLRPGGAYIIWFEFRDAQVAEVAISLHVLTAQADAERVKKLGVQRFLDQFLVGK